MPELTYPAVGTSAIPFFSAMYPVAVYEYVEHTGDLSILSEVMPTMLGIMERIYSWIDETGLIKNQPKPYWNFYEWSHGNAGGKGFGEAGTYGLIINCAFVYACEKLAKLCQLSDIALPSYDLEALKMTIVKTFYNEKNGLFRTSTCDETCTVLGNAFAMLIGLGDERPLKAIKGDTCETELVPASLSMLPYVYDVIPEHDPEGGKDFVLGDIRKTYSYMLSRGATSFWETIEGEADFHYAGSLCHGWSAMPVYYLKKLVESSYLS